MNQKKKLKKKSIQSKYFSTKATSKWSVKVLHLEEISMKACSFSGIWATIVTKHFFFVLIKIHKILSSTEFFFSFFWEERKTIFPGCILETLQCCQTRLSNLLQNWEGFCSVRLSILILKQKAWYKKLNRVYKIFCTGCHEAWWEILSRFKRCFSNKC